MAATLFCIIWYTIDHFRDKKWVKESTKKYNENKADAFIKSDCQGNGDYNKYLLDELIDKCNPQNFMEPYNYEKVKIANELYPRLLNCDGNDNAELVEVRKEAISKLGIVLSTSNIYEELCKTCNPQQFMNPYNPTKVAKANELYFRVLQNKMNIDALEKIRDEARVLFDNAHLKTQQWDELPSQTNSSNDDNDNAQVHTQQEVKPIVILFVVGITLLFVLVVMLNYFLL